MTTITIENPKPEDVRVGDVLTYSWHGHEATGEVHQDEDGDLLVGGTEMTIYKKQPDWIILIRLTREVDPLPTEPGSVGTATVRGVPGVRVMLDNEGFWVTHVEVGSWYTHRPDDVANYVPELDAPETDR